jgi:antitoxin (DNA-binding transcriptional repressor) of toxin-antitoxin stability system
VPTKTIEIQDIPKQFMEFLSLISDGTEVVFKRDNKPFARLTPMITTPSKPRVAGLNKNPIWMSEDFDAPLPDSFWLGTAG